MDQIPSILSDTSSKIVAATKKTDKFLLKDPVICENSKLFTKVLYDVTKFLETSPSKNTLPELIIDNFDPEQVWAGVELLNTVKLSHLEAKFSSLNLSKIKQQSLLIGKPQTKKEHVEEVFDEELEDDELLSETEGKQEEEEPSDQEDDEDEKAGSDDDIINDPDFQNMSDSDGDDLPLFDNLDEDELEEDLDEKDNDDFDDSSKRKLKESGGGRKTELDDQFFKLSDMEKFHDIEDPSDMLKGKNDDEEDIIDLFDDIPDEDGDEAANMMYGDYWQDNADAGEAEDLMLKMTMKTRRNGLRK